MSARECVASNTRARQSTAPAAPIIIGDMPHIIYPSILEETRLMAIDHFTRSKALMLSLISSLLFRLTSVQLFMD